jgi:hypothetical protein
MWDKYQLTKIAGGNVASDTFIALPPASAHDAADFQATADAFSSKDNALPCCSAVPVESDRGALIGFDDTIPGHHNAAFSPIEVYRRRPLRRGHFSFEPSAVLAPCARPRSKAECALSVRAQSRTACSINS